MNLTLLNTGVALIAMDGYLYSQGSSWDQLGFSVTAYNQYFMVGWKYYALGTARMDLSFRFYTDPYQVSLDPGGTIIGNNFLAEG